MSESTQLRLAGLLLLVVMWILSFARNAGRTYWVAGLHEALIHEACSLLGIVPQEGCTAEDLIEAASKATLASLVADRLAREQLASEQPQSDGGDA